MQHDLDEVAVPFMPRTKTCLDLGRAKTDDAKFPAIYRHPLVQIVRSNFPQRHIQLEVISNLTVTTLNISDR